MTMITELNNISNALKAKVEAEKEMHLSSFLKNAVCSKSKSAPDDMASLKKEVETCTRCALNKSRNNAVFGDGNVHAKLVFVGEAPGYEEDIQGKPFVGQAGALLTKIIEAMGLRRSDVYICNVLKCRPPQNRNPLPEEVALCKRYLTKQLDMITPRIICALGKFAAQALLAVDTPITKLRGRFHDFGKVKLMPTFHPAYLLRNPLDKKLVWEDMKKVRDALKDAG